MNKSPNRVILKKELCMLHLAPTHLLRAYGLKQHFLNKIALVSDLETLEFTFIVIEWLIGPKIDCDYCRL